MTAACLAEKFSLLFYFAPARFFSSKRKRKFFCFGFRAQSAGQRGFASARGQKFPPLEPFHFCPLASEILRRLGNSLKIGYNKIIDTQNLC